MDLISVIIPYYKKKDSILKTVNSVLNQTYQNFEIIIIYDDECKNDLNLIKKIKDKDNRIFIIQNKKKMGAGNSRNIGISNSKGGFVAFIDADDLWKNDKLSNVKVDYCSEVKTFKFSFTDQKKKLITVFAER